jgi:uncharacterized membrane protein YdjX (TVP38/TMEM64 family)
VEAMKESLSQKRKKSILFFILAILAAIVIAVAILYGQPLWELFSSQDKIEQTIKDAGPLGPLVLILLQILQTVAAPIPGQVTAFAAGYLFGTALGTIYAMIGVTIGFTLVFILVRKLGRPFVEYFVDKKTLKKFDYLAESKGVFIFFLMALLPFFPDDLICFVAGLTKIRIKTLVIVTFLGRLPTNLIYAFAGEGVANSNTELVLYVLGVGLVGAAVAWWKRDKLEEWALRLSRSNTQK